jgi:hypothetical protein
MVYGEPNQPDGVSFKGPGKGLPGPDFELPLEFRQARQRNTVLLASISTNDPVAAALLNQVHEDLTFAHTGKTVSEITQESEDRLTAQMRRDFGGVAVQHGWD